MNVKQSCSQYNGNILTLVNFIFTQIHFSYTKCLNADFLRFPYFVLSKLCITCMEHDMLTY